MSETTSNTDVSDVPVAPLGNTMRASAHSTLAQNQGQGAAESQGDLAQRVAVIDLENEDMVDASQEMATSQKSSDEAKAPKGASTSAEVVANMPTDPAFATLVASKSEWLAKHSKKSNDASDSSKASTSAPNGEDADGNAYTAADIVMSGGLGVATAEESRQEAIYKSWKASGRNACTQVLSTGGTCNGFHPQELHDDTKAVAAAQRHNALQTVRNAHPELLKSEADLKAERNKAAKERKQRQEVLETWRKEDAIRQEALVYDKGEKPDANSKKRQSQTQIEAGGPKRSYHNKKQKQGKACTKCGRYHPAPCRACNTCKSLYCKCSNKPAKTGETGQWPNDSSSTQPPKAQSGLTMSREEVLQHASNNVSTDAGLAGFITLMNAGHRPARPPSQQQSKTTNAAQSMKIGR